MRGGVDSRVARTCEPPAAGVPGRRHRTFGRDLHIWQIGFLGIKDDDDLDGAVIVLPENALKRSLHLLGTIVGGDHDGDRRRVRHVDLSRTSDVCATRS